MEKKCRQCGVYLPDTYITDICLNCSRENLKKSFAKNPELKQVFKETIEELRKPENVKKMADDTVKFMKLIQSIQNK